MSNNVCLLILVGSLLLLLLSFERRTAVSGKEWTDEELRKLEKQWAEHDGEEDEETERIRLMEEKRGKKPNLDLNNLQNMSPEELLAATKAGQPLMVFVQAIESLSEKEAEKLSERWQQGLHNAAIDVQRYNVGSNRFIFMFSDGADAFKAKSYLLDQPECLHIDIDNQKSFGRGHPEYGTEKKTGKTEL